MDLYEHMHVHDNIDIKGNQSKDISPYVFVKVEVKGVGVLSEYDDTLCLISLLPLENHRKCSDPTGRTALKVLSGPVFTHTFHLIPS